MLSFTSVKLFKSIIDGFPSRKSARKIGIEAAMMVMALSATPHITSCTVLAIPRSDLTIGDGGRVEGRCLPVSWPRLWTKGTLMSDAAPALWASVSSVLRDDVGGQCGSQDSHAHGKQDSPFFLLVHHHVAPPDYFPGE